MTLLWSGHFPLTLMLASYEHFGHLIFFFFFFNARIGQPFQRTLFSCIAIIILWLLLKQLFVYLQCYVTLTKLNVLHELQRITGRFCFPTYLEWICIFQPNHHVFLLRKVHTEVIRSSFSSATERFSSAIGSVWQMLAANDQCSTTRKALQIAVEMLLCKNV